MRLQKLRKTILLISFLLFPLLKPFLSPVTTIMGVFEGVVAGGLAIYIFLFVSSLFPGRFFCGCHYIC